MPGRPDWQTVPRTIYSRLVDAQGSLFLAAGATQSFEYATGVLDDVVTVTAIGAIDVAYSVTVQTVNDENAARETMLGGTVAQTVDHFGVFPNLGGDLSIAVTNCGSLGRDCWFWVHSYIGATPAQLRRRSWTNIVRGVGVAAGADAARAVLLDTQSFERVSVVVNSTQTCDVFAEHRWKRSAAAVVDEFDELLGAVAAATPTRFDFATTGECTQIRVRNTAGVAADIDVFARAYDGGR